MNILFTRFPLESANGGAENQTLWLAAGLKGKGHGVSFLGSCPVLLKRFADGGFASTLLDIGTPPVTKWGAISFAWRKNSMQKQLLENVGKPDAMFMLSLSEKILLTEEMSKRGTKVFWIEHDRIGRWLSGNPWLGALKKAAKHATIACVSELSRKMYLDLGFDADRVIAIPNGIPLPTSVQLKKSDGSNIVVGCVSRLSREKGVDVLIQSIANLPEVTLKIVGKGPDEGYLRTLITEDTKRMGQPRIELQANVENLASFYQSLDGFVLPSSDHDPFGLVAAEAMSYGIPTIITSACGIASSLKAGDEVLVADAGSVESLSNKIRAILDPMTRGKLSNAGRAAVTSRLTVEQMVGGYEKLLSR